jgi:putative protease
MYAPQKYGAISPRIRTSHVSSSNDKITSPTEINKTFQKLKNELMLYLQPSSSKYHPKTIQKYEEHYDHILMQNWDGVLIRNYESYEFLREHDFEKNIVTDYNLYQFNSYATNFWMNEQVESTTAPLELNYRELQDAGVENSELIVYGYLPMMVSAQCIRKTTEGCKKQKGTLTFKDRYQKTFTVKNHCDYCYNMIYNTAPLVLTDQKPEIKSLNPKALRLNFTIEDRNTMKDILRLYEEVFVKGERPKEPDFEFTRGHFKRGIK